MIVRNVIALVALLASATAGICPSVCSARTWTSKDGHYTTEAELVSANNTRVRLKKADGQEVDIPLAKLSDDDRRFVESWTKQNRTPPSKPARNERETRSKKGEPKLAPLRFKIFDEELTMQAPAGAKVEVQGVFPVVRYGDRFVISIEPNSDSDLPEFKERFGASSSALTLKKALVQESNALAYTVNVNAFNDSASAYMVVVTVGNKKYTCSDESLEDINRRQKYTADDIQLMIRCARTLSPAATK